MKSMSRSRGLIVAFCGSNTISPHGLVGAITGRSERAAHGNPNGLMTKLYTIGLALFAGLLAAACGASEDIDDPAVDPIGDCNTRIDAETVAPDWTGQCGYVGELQQGVIASIDELDAIREWCWLDELETLMNANPDQHLAFVVESANATCRLSIEQSLGYQDETGLTVVAVFNDGSAGCMQVCAMSMAVWTAFLVEPGTQVDFCTGVVGGCL